MIKGTADIEAIRETIQSTGGVRFHIRHSRSNLTTTCRMWHWDGHVLGRATGGGFDKAGCALGQAVEKLFQEELKGLKPRWVYDPVKGGAKNEKGLYGLTRNSDGTITLDGACGLETVLIILEALGFKADRYETGPASMMILGRK